MPDKIALYFVVVFVEREEVQFTIESVATGVNLTVRLITKHIFYQSRLRWELTATQNPMPFLRCPPFSHVPEAAVCYLSAINLYCQIRRFSTAARLETEVAELMEKDRRAALEHVILH